MKTTFLASLPSCGWPGNPHPRSPTKVLKWDLKNGETKGFMHTTTHACMCVCTRTYSHTHVSRLPHESPQSATPQEHKEGQPPLSDSWRELEWAFFSWQKPDQARNRMEISVKTSFREIESSYQWHVRGLNKNCWISSRHQDGARSPMSMAGPTLCLNLKQKTRLLPVPLAHSVSSTGSGMKFISLMSHFHSSSWSRILFTSMFLYPSFHQKPHSKKEFCSFVPTKVKINDVTQYASYSRGSYLLSRDKCNKYF